MSLTTQNLDSVGCHGCKKDPLFVINYFLFLITYSSLVLNIPGISLKDIFCQLFSVYKQQTDLSHLIALKIFLLVQIYRTLMFTLFFTLFIFTLFPNVCSVYILNEALWLCNLFLKCILIHPLTFHRVTLLIIF